MQSPYYYYFKKNRILNMIYEHNLSNLIVKRTIIFKVYTTGGGKQEARFRNAIAKVKQSLGHRYDLHFIYLTTEQVRKQEMTEGQFVDFFSDCDYHVFLTHVAQGQVNRPHSQEPYRKRPWNTEVLLEELKRLQDHKGFPYRDFLFCPAFTQDKFLYLFLLREYTIPSLRISLKLCEGDMVIPASVVEEIRVFIAAHNIDESTEESPEACKFVFKMPFTTHSQAIVFPSTLQEILEAIQIMFRRYKGKIHYGILQPCLKNRKEYKIIFNNGSFLHENFEPKTPKGSKCFGDSASRRVFAEEVMSVLKERIPGLLYAPVMRLDIMFYKGKMVLNEVESLEAVSQGPKDYKLYAHIDSFWRDYIIYCVRTIDD